MRWDRLLGDLDGPLDAERRAEEALQASDLAAAERARVGLDARFAAHAGAAHVGQTHLGAVHVVLADGTQLDGTVTDAGSGWFLLAAGSGRHLVRTAAVDVVRGLGVRARTDDPAAGPSPRTATWASAVRALATERALVDVHLRGRTLTGAVALVGADHLDVADPGGTPGSARRTPWTVPFGAVLRISRR
ncbi:hypothetical protein CLV28_2503 [Sediminihabitans luteus]|uniref:Uncharacterized protein n=1 Tax=Sediminihabitans luteus TaxID=1138585 RepID=A0A2M9CDL1_9CELL|nr:hypothetical protein [Sediminihabitans luteus]PJJ70026.1 hypothetical protein CLV28_2503 [Sediminihabitans luteus]GIJ00190.1 hypothetical protein Slu03_25670 [Sediminihabitans luteus]